MKGLPLLLSPPQCLAFRCLELPSTPPPPAVSTVFQAEEPDPEEFLLDPPGQLPGDRAPHSQLPGAGGPSTGQAAASLPGWHARCGQLCGRAPFPPSEGQAWTQGVPGRGGSCGACTPAGRHRPPFSSTLPFGEGLVGRSSRTGRRGGTGAPIKELAVQLGGESQAQNGGTLDLFKKDRL